MKGYINIYISLSTELFIVYTTSYKYFCLRRITFPEDKFEMSGSLCKDEMYHWMPQILKHHLLAILEMDIRNNNFVLAVNDNHILSKNMIILCWSLHELFLWVFRVNTVVAVYKTIYEIEIL